MGIAAVATTDALSTAMPKRILALAANPEKMNKVVTAIRRFSNTGDEAAAANLARALIEAKRLTQGAIDAEGLLQPSH